MLEINKEYIYLTTRSSVIYRLSQQLDKEVKSRLLKLMKLAINYYLLAFHCWMQKQQWNASIVISIS